MRSARAGSAACPARRALVPQRKPAQLSVPRSCGNCPALMPHTYPLHTQSWRQPPLPSAQRSAARALKFKRRCTRGRRTRAGAAGLTSRTRPFEFCLRQRHCTASSCPRGGSAAAPITHRLCLGSTGAAALLRALSSYKRPRTAGGAPPGAHRRRRQFVKRRRGEEEERPPALARPSGSVGGGRGAGGKRAGAAQQLALGIKRWVRGAPAATSGGNRERGESGVYVH